MQPISQMVREYGSRVQGDKHKMQITYDATRTAIFEALRLDALHHISVLDISSPKLAEHGHQSWVWDASAMPAGGHYFPAFIDILENLERNEGVTPETHILCETTTGTAGIALGFIARRLGYQVVVFMPEDMPRRRIQAVQDNLPPDSELILTPSGQYVAGAVRSFKRFIVKHRNSYRGKKLCLVDHSRRDEAVSAISATILKGLKRLPSLTKIDFAVGALGNGTSSSALFRSVRLVYPSAKRVGVEPIEASTAFIKKYGKEEFLRRFNLPQDSKPHSLLGTGGWGISCPHLDVSEIDEIWPLAPHQWRLEQELLKSRGVDVGNSSAACQAVVEAIAERLPAGGETFFSIVYDRSSVY